MDENELLASSVRRSPNCLGEDDMTDLLVGNASASAKEHLASCAHCQTELAMLREFEAATPGPGEAAAVRQIEQKLRSAPNWKGAAEPARSGSWFRNFWASPMRGLAFAGLAAMLVVTVMVNRPGPAPVVVTDGDQVRSGVIEGVSPLGDLASPPTRLTWRAVNGAASYDLQLIEVDGTTIWTGQSVQAEAALPEAARSLMTNRKTLHWRIKAASADKTEIAVSPLMAFRVMTEAK